MKRTAQWFTMYTRLCAVILAVGITLAAHLDAFEIWSRLWTTPSLRASLVQLAPDLVKEYSSVESGQTGTAQVPVQIGWSREVLDDAMKKLAEKKNEAFRDIPPVQSFSKLDDAVKWLREEPKLGKSDREQLVEEYKVLVFSGQIDRIRQQLAGAGFQLIARPYSFWPPGHGIEDLPGMLVFAGFVSLGAPFWYNVLKNLANLRSMVSIRQEKEQA
jgi:hypothetical protein